MPFIQNVSMAAVQRGYYRFQENNTVLIQIQSVDSPKFVVAPNKFLNIHQFNFDDVSENDQHCITENQSQRIGVILRTALASCQNVVVHCHAGICRSGAVSEVGEMIGFDRVGVITTNPNITVKSKLMKELGLGYY